MFLGGNVKPFTCKATKIQDFSAAPGEVVLRKVYDRGKDGTRFSPTYISPLSRSASCTASCGDRHNIAGYPCLELDKACNCPAVFSETTRIVAPIPGSTAGGIQEARSCNPENPRKGMDSVLYPIVKFQDSY
jgi:hypothetical protein